MTDFFVKVVFSHVDDYLQNTNDGTSPPQPLDEFTFDLQRFDFSGSGTEADPYEIKSAADLQQLATDVNNGTTYSGSYFKVTANIDLSELGEDYSWTPIGTSSRTFAGTFDGGSSEGYTISNLSHNATNTSYVGLFGRVSGTIKNVTLETVSITITAKLSNAGNNVGGLVGYLDSSGTIDNVTLDNVTISLNSNLGKKSTCNYVGGLVGQNYGGTVSGTVKGVDIGITFVSTASASQDIGGLVGYNINNGTVTGTVDNGTVNFNCMAGVKVGGQTNVGGFVGTNNATINSPGFYYTESAVGSTNSSEGYTKLYCLTVPEHVVVTVSGDFVKDGNNYYVTENAQVAFAAEEGYVLTNDSATSAIITKDVDLTDTELDDFVVKVTEAATIPWEGDGTTSSPYEITTAAELKAVAEYINSNGHEGVYKYFVLKNDIDLSELGEDSWTPIGTEENPFYGQFASSTGIDPDTGDEIRSTYTISGGTVSGSSNVGGLVGSNYTYPGTVTGGTVSGNTAVGGIVGWNTKTVTNCTVSGGTVSGTSNVGGLVGSNDGTGTVSDGTAITTITFSGTDSTVGGVVGYNSGTVGTADSPNKFYNSTYDAVANSAVDNNTRHYKILSMPSGVTASGDTITDNTDPDNPVTYYAGTVTLSGIKTGYIYSSEQAEITDNQFTIDEDTTVGANLAPANYYVFQSGKTYTLATTENVSDYPDLTLVYMLTLPDDRHSKRRHACYRYRRQLLRGGRCHTIGNARLQIYHE